MVKVLDVAGLWSEFLTESLNWLKLLHDNLQPKGMVCLFIELVTNRWAWRKTRLLADYIDNSVTNSTGATQRFSADQKTSSEQKNRSLFISGQSQMRVKSDWGIEGTPILLFCAGLVIGTKVLGWPRLSLLHCNIINSFTDLITTNSK